MLNAQNQDTSQSLNSWINNRLSSILNFPVTQDLVTYILSIENPRDLKDYLGTLLDLNQPHHLQFYAELVQKKQGNFGDIPGIQSYKKQNKDDTYVSTKASERKKKDRNKANRVQDENSTPTFSEMPKENSGKKKTKFINLYSQEGQAKDVILLKGRHMCNCQASKHRLVNNCLKCGRVVCEQEGSGPCLFCNNLVCSQEEQQILDSGTKQAEHLYNKLLVQKKPLDWENALEQRNRLLEYDRTSQRRTHVIDDESDYFTSNSVWLSKEEREKLQKYEKELKAKRHAPRSDRRLTLDFAGRTFVEENSAEEYFAAEDKILKELSESVNNPTKYVGDGDLHPTFSHFKPVFQDFQMNDQAYSQNHLGGKKNEGPHRIQDREFLEMSDEGLCLSMHQPWASLLVAGIKKHEGRVWYTSHRGRLWIAATAKPPLPQDIKEIEHRYEILLGERIKFPSAYPTSCLLGCVNVVDCLPQEEYTEKYPDGESDSPFVFICENPFELPIRFPIQGKHKIYKMDPKIHVAAQKSLQRLCKIQSESMGQG